MSWIAKKIMVAFLFVLGVAMIPLYPFVWVLCRIEAKQCPQCGEAWFTTLEGEWGEEDWRCGRCNHTWHVPYNCG